MKTHGTKAERSGRIARSVPVAQLPELTSDYGKPNYTTRGAPGGIRTHIATVVIGALCPLSYRGTKENI